MTTTEVKELFYLNDVNSHKLYIVSFINDCIKILLDRGIAHDDTKFSPIEKNHYIDPVYKLNTENIPHGSDEYKECTNAMEPGWKHHKEINDHHCKNAKDVSLFSLLEMTCDWFAASKRKNNEPEEALKYETFEEPIKSILMNTIHELKRHV